MKQPLVSVIVPTKSSAEFLDACLSSIENQTYQNVEIIVVDNNSTDKTSEIAMQFTDKVYDHGPERSAQRNFGVTQSKGDYVLIIDSDMELSPKVVEECVSLVIGDPRVKAIVVHEESFGEGFWAQCKRLERSFYVGLPWMEAARFFPKSVFDEFRGYDEANTGTEDYDLPQRITQKYPNSIQSVKAVISHNEQRISLLRTCKKKFYYAQKLKQYKNIEANKANFYKQASPVERYRLFLARPTKLFQKPVYGLGLLFMKTCEFGAGGFGYLLWGTKR